MRVVVPALATPLRLVSYVTGVTLVASALSWPLFHMSQVHQLARVGQQVAICVLGAPLIWLGCAFHGLSYGLPVAQRRWVTRWFVRPSRATPFLTALTSPFTAWFLYFSAFLIWHDPSFVDAVMPRRELQTLSLLAMLFVALLFWQQITFCGPRRYTRASLTARIAMLLGMEIPNIIAGITIALGNRPLYSYYASTALAAGKPLDPGAFLSQQSLSGALTWVFGSIMYVTSIVLVVNEVFRREGIDLPQPARHWDADERFIAPGLEDRLRS
jgi:cytochrome c oxidase assembly factor CtaG